MPTDQLHKPTSGYWDCDCGRECRDPETTPGCRREWVETPRKTPRHPAEEQLAFWTAEAKRTADVLEAQRRENIELERHYRAALIQIEQLQRQVRLLMAEASHAE